MDYDFRQIEAKWQERWERSGLFDVDIEALPRKKDGTLYVLVMFPYPSGARLHMGHWYQYGIMDSWVRFQRMRGHKVFHPMGFDAFGLPAENYAIKQGIHPEITTAKNVEIMTEQFRRMGVSYDWKYAVNTSKPEYYRWNQWLFLQLHERGVAYRKDAPVNWCPQCNTVLANEQVLDGKCERCGTEVTQKNLKQWFFRITDYAQRLLDGLEDLDWPHKTLAMQRNWLGRSEGAELRFAVAGTELDFTVFTTRPDTLFGATYVVFAPEHPLVKEITTPDRRADVDSYLARSQKYTEVERLSADRDKSGAFTGAYAINPANGEKIPIWVGDYVLVSYGTGVVMAVPAHDERDYAFAKAFDLPIREVITGGDVERAAWEGEGTGVNSGAYDGMPSAEMKVRIVADLHKREQAAPKINFRIRDWLVSRQRYWGTPIPIVYCDTHGEVPVPLDQLPVLLPADAEFKPTGESPLRRSESFINTTCPKCGGPATREADTLDTFVCSSWYQYRYVSPNNDNAPFDRELAAKMLPVDRYVGGAEHAVMHLLYARFVGMFLHDIGWTDFDEPFPALTHQGLVLGPDGRKMSKSRGNTVSPDPYVEGQGSDVLRMYLMFGFNYVEGGPWDDGGFKAISRFVDRLGRLFETYQPLLVGPAPAPREPGSAERDLLFVFHSSVQRVTVDTERFQFNTAIARMMELYNALRDYENAVAEDQRDQGLLREILHSFVTLLAPFAPHFAEEWWERFGETESVFNAAWPEHDPRRLQRDEVTMAVMVNGRRRGEIKVAANADESTIVATARQVDAVAKRLEGKTVKNTVVVPRKLVNLIAPGA